MAVFCGRYRKSRFQKKKQTDLLASSFVWHQSQRYIIWGLYKRQNFHLNSDIATKLKKIKYIQPLKARNELQFRCMPRYKPNRTTILDVTKTY
jgi:hypothetical protein